MILPYAKAGTWKAEVANGSPAILRIQRADILDKPKVTAKVTGRGASRVLHYEVARIPGQEVVFAETSRSAQHILKSVTGGGRGTVRYRLAEARSAKRAIEAQVYQDGLPREHLKVARYVAGNPKLKRARVHLRRSGSAASVTWSKVPTAVRYDVRVTYADGRRLLLEPKGAARSVRVPAVGRKGGVRIAVVAYTRHGPDEHGDGAGEAREGQAQAQEAPAAPEVGLARFIPWVGGGHPAHRSGWTGSGAMAFTSSCGLPGAFAVSL